MTERIFLKRSIPVQVEFAGAPGIVSTMEGDVSYEQGDAILSGIRGEKWPVARAVFDKTYTALVPGSHEKAGLFIKKPIPVWATRIDKRMTILLPDGRGRLEGRPGDWVVVSPDGSTWIVADEIFEETYEPA